MAKKNKGKNKGTDATVTRSTSVITPCHYGNVKVFDKPFPCYGGGWSRGFHVIKNSIILDLADVVREPKVLFWNMEVPTELNDRYSPDASVIRIQWADGGVPTLSPLFWHKLADYLLDKQKTVIVCCMGGHGRTGTLLAILAGIYRINGDADIGEWVRSHHCHKAIETYSQVDYITEVTGLETSIVPSWAHELDTWKNWKSANYHDKPGTVTTYASDSQKVFGYFDKNDVYHTGYPPEDAEVSCTVGQDDDGNDVFEYIYDKDSKDFLPSY